MTGMLERLADLLRRWRPPNIDPDLDRGAGVRESRPAAPSGRSSAMALDEPEPEIMVSAIAAAARSQMSMSADGAAWLRLA